MDKKLKSVDIPCRHIQTALDCFHKQRVEIANRKDVGFYVVCRQCNIEISTEQLFKIGQ